jgi:outer membrane protein assembly factor BamB
VIVVHFAAAVLALGAVGPTDWPQWRGPNGTGTADGTPPAKGDQLWKVALPDKGNGSPIVAGGKVYLQTASADGTKRALVCLSAADGKELWTAAHDSEKANTHPKASLATNTPCADAGGVYCVWWDGPTISLRAYDPKTGKERWNAPLGKNATSHGAHHSPAVHGGIVFVNVDQDSKAEFFAFDARTGKKLWSAERPAHRASYTTPVLTRTGKTPELIVGSATRIDSYDPRTGKSNWHYTLAVPKGAPQLRMVGAPQFADGLLVANIGDSGGSRYVVALTPGGSGDVTETAKVWEAKKDTPYIPGLLVRGEHLFWMDDKGIAACAEAKTGKLVWTERVFKTTVFASPVMIGEGILAVSEQGRVAVWKAAKEFERVEEWELGEAVIASPAVANGRVYVRGATHLFCYGKK